MNNDARLRTAIIKLAHANPDNIREKLLPVLKEAGAVPTQKELTGLYREADDSLLSFRGKWASFALSARKIPDFDGAKLISEVREKRLALEKAVEDAASIVENADGSGKKASDDDDVSLITEKMTDGLQAIAANAKALAKLIEDTEKLAKKAGIKSGGDLYSKARIVRDIGISALGVIKDSNKEWDDE